MDTIEKLEKLILKEKGLLETISNYKSFFNALGEYEHFFISSRIISKIVSIQSKIITQQDNLLFVFSSLRFIFETLIQSRLLIAEQEYIYKLYYSVYEHQVNKTNRFIERLKREITLIDKYVNFENDGLKNLQNINDLDVQEIKKILDEKIKNENEIDIKAEKELTIFFGDYKFNGFKYQKYLMESHLLPALQSRLEELEKLKLEQAKKIMKDARINSLFEFKKQHNNVYEKLKDIRSWKMKAKEVDLRDEYFQIYELSSSILHSTSYSIITPLETEENESQFASDLIIKYSYEIIKNIDLFLDLNRLKNIKIIK